MPPASFWAAPGSAAYVACRQHFEKQVAIPPAAQLTPPLPTRRDCATARGAKGNRSLSKPGRMPAQSKRSCFTRRTPPIPTASASSDRQSGEQSVSPGPGQPPEPAVPRRRRGAGAQAGNDLLVPTQHRQEPAGKLILRRSSSSCRLTFPLARISNVPGILMKPKSTRRCATRPA